MNSDFESTNYTVEETDLGISQIMLRIDIASVPAWDVDKDISYWVPKSVDTICPFCNRPTSLTTSCYSLHPHLITVGMLGRCVRCNAQAKIWIIGAKAKTNQSGNMPDEIWMLPKPSLREIAIAPDNVPTKIFNAYKEAVGCFNNGHWRATVTECGRALEGITKDKFPKAKSGKTLHSTLQNLRTELGKITDYLPLFEPILQLGNALRLGRNTSAHFDTEKDPDKEVAEEILDLAEYLMKYFYVLPQKSSDLEARIEALGSEADELDEGDRVG